MMNLAYILRLAFFVASYMSMNHSWNTINRCFYGFVTYINDFLFWTGVTWCLFNWLFLLRKITQKSIISGIAPVNKYYVNFMFITWIVFMFIVFSVAWGVSWTKTNSNFKTFDIYTRVIRVVVELPLAGILLITGGILYYRFKRLLDKYSVGVRIKIILSTLLITLPMIARAILNILWIVYDFRTHLLIESIQENNNWFPTYVLVYYTFADLLPMGAQILSFKIAVVHYSTSHTHGGRGNYISDSTTSYSMLSTPFTSQNSSNSMIDKQFIMSPSMSRNENQATLMIKNRLSTSIDRTSE